jgi:hypothetical protein
MLVGCGAFHRTNRYSIVKLARRGSRPTSLDSSPRTPFYSRNRTRSLAHAAIGQNPDMGLRATDFTWHRVRKASGRASSSPHHFRIHGQPVAASCLKDSSQSVYTFNCLWRKLAEMTPALVEVARSSSVAVCGVSPRREIPWTDQATAR